jgi:hypothetical protein
VQALGNQASPVDLEMIGVVYELSGRPREAMVSFQKALEKTNSPYPGLHTALLAMELKEAETRDAALKRVVEKGESFKENGKARVGEIEIAKAMSEALAAAGTGKPEAATLVKILENRPPSRRANDSYFVGRFLELHGLSKDARALYERCAHESEPGLWNAAMAANALREMK